jgi:two-component system, chemotaxis family, CheB/CheR fusion protein
MRKKIETRKAGRPEGNFPIVGIGASAGGLAAFEAFFSGMPPDPGMAFVLVQHLAPDHTSLLCDIIRRHTRMEVFEVEDGMPVRINRVYIIPPGRDMAFLNGTLQLFEPGEPHGRRMPIDFFFHSLAQDQHERAIGIILSGTGSDGTLGVRAIKSEGGMVMAQNTASSEFDGMPRNAIATGLMDYELPPAEMPAAIIAYVAHAFGKLPRTGTMLPHRSEGAMKRIFILLRAQTGHDFSKYKPSTIKRRIERRMAVQRIEGLESYVKFLQRTPAEVEALFRDLLISVTNFFRDPDVFRMLQEQVVPKLFEGKHPGAAVRVWSAGCCTGEEAYSLAILLAEHMEALKQGYKVQVFATDIDSRAIAAARAGVYPPSIAADITPGRLARFFTAGPDGGTYRVKKAIRDLLVFSEQDVIKDPPFSKLDLVSCRNLLIYLDAELQKKLLSLFHYSLKPGGILLLGTSEGIGGMSGLFAALDRQAKLFRRKEDCLPPVARAPIQPVPITTHIPPDAAPAKDPFREQTGQVLRSSNEEMHSVNEELQSTNEKLETVKEEMQSANEELSTVNAELQNKVSALTQADNDMNNLIAGTGIATVFVDFELRILRFTPSATEIINLILSDVGRPVAHIVSNLADYDSLVADVQAVLKTLVPKVVDVQTQAGKWFTLRIQPYRTLDNVIEGAVLTFVDITDRKRVEDDLHKSNSLARLAVVVRDAHDAVTVQDLDGRTLAWNPGAVRMYGWTETEALALNVRDRIPQELQEGAMDTLAKLSRSQILEPCRTQRLSKEGAVKEVSIISTALLNEAGEMYAVATTERKVEVPSARPLPARFASPTD